MYLIILVKYKLMIVKIVEYSLVQYMEGEFELWIHFYTSEEKHFKLLM